MTPAERRARYKAGICSTCPSKRRPARRQCQRCASRNPGYMKRYRLRIKELGLCAWGGCKEKPDTHMCPKHQAYTTAKSVAWAEKRRAHVLKLDRKRRRARIEAGMCVRCSGALYTDTLCKVHHDRDLARARARRRAAGVPLDTRCPCTTCGEPGHRSGTCPLQAPSHVRIEDYATARHAE